VSAPHCGSLREHYPADADLEPRPSWYGKYYESAEERDYEEQYEEHYEPDPGPPPGYDEYEPEPPAPVEDGPDWYPDDGPFDSSEWPF
jgi:hypothetical protein